MPDWTIVLGIFLLSIIILVYVAATVLGFLPQKKKDVGIFKAKSVQRVWLYSPKYGFDTIEEVRTDIADKFLVKLTHYSRYVETLRFKANDYGPANTIEVAPEEGLVGGDRFFIHLDDQTINDLDTTDAKFRMNRLISEITSLRRDNKRLREQRLEDTMDAVNTFKVMKQGIEVAPIYKNKGGYPGD